MSPASSEACCLSSGQSYTLTTDPMSFFLLGLDCAVLPQAWPLQWAVAAAGQLHPLGGHFPLRPHLRHVLCLSVVSATEWRGGCEGGEPCFACFLGCLLLTTEE